MRTLAIATVFALLAPGLAFADATPPGSPAPSPVPSATLEPSIAAVVHVRGSAFVPATLTIHIGQSVRFVNDDDVEHDVTATNGAFASPELERGQGFVHTFVASGTVRYGCNDHAFMHGTIVVVPRAPG